MAPKILPDDWWPEWMADLSAENPLASDRVVVAEIQEAVDYQRYRQTFTALVPVEHITEVLERPGGIGHEVSASGPHPLDWRGEWHYAPRFWVDATESLPDGLEPLVVSWGAANQLVLWPDQGFLMTYGLIPRLVSTDIGLTMHWDDPAGPRTDVVVAQVLSSHNFGTHTAAYVAIDRSFLQDYATIRDKALVQVYYLGRTGPLTEEVRGALGSEKAVEFRLKGRLLDLQVLPGEREQPVLAQVWGVRILLRPASAPISGARGEYGNLTWPGISEPVTSDSARQLAPYHIAYVRDTVLDVYEGRPEFTIYPESGSVSLGNQWSVSHTRRIGRDLIAVDLKKLYEGNRPETVHHWHEHVVDRSPDGATMGESPNVATRARRLVYGLAHLGAELAAVASTLFEQPVSASDFVGLDSRDLDYRGWWTAGHAEPITHHIPLELGKERFLARCDDLYKFVVEGLAERQLRRLLFALDFPATDLKDFRSLKLLDHLLRLAELANHTGLRLTEDRAELRARLSDQPGDSPIARLFALASLRQLSDHRSRASQPRKFDQALEAFGLDGAAYVGGWSTALDAVYDGLGETLDTAAALLFQATSRC